jgi:hypothetical protein
VRELTHVRRFQRLEPIADDITAYCTSGWGVVPGLAGYLDGSPVGWISLGPGEKANGPAAYGERLPGRDVGLSTPGP